MNKIFIEAENKTTPEYNFLKAFVNSHFPDKEIEFICIGGIGNLFNETNINQMSQAQALDDQVLVLLDADTVAKGYGFAKRKADIEREMQSHSIAFQYFIYPNNNDDGEVETLMELAARRDLHQVFFDCFEDYEKCVSGVKDANGQPLYNTPNLKGKLHTYINSQKLNNKSRRRLGAGDWLFNDNNYWNLNASDLEPLKVFLSNNLK
jgi:disulfide oxidoreductase YuzD